ncbi:MAG: rhomboid family intramembrane serine protease [Chryseotalea sp. WA131a]|jgi:membrane associated rhomboid family serine protease|nr:MAG: rhomboid family intramembrane serine protease [Chryseotalea sp. WA131a]
MFNITPLVRTIIIINVIVFLAQNLLEGLYVTQYLSLWDFKSGLFRPYQFFTYMFAHGSFMHIFFNMLAFASFAPILESYWGEKKFLSFYIITGIGAGVIYAIFNYFFPGNGGYMLGASGALYGILMAFGLQFPNLEIMLLFPPIPLKAKYMVFVMGFITYAMDRSGSVAHLAHFGGALVAYLVMTYWRSQGK